MVIKSFNPERFPNYGVYLLCYANILVMNLYHACYLPDGRCL